MKKVINKKMLLIVTIMFIIGISIFTFIRYKKISANINNVIVEKDGIKISASNHIYKNTYVKDSDTLVLTMNNKIKSSDKEMNPLTFNISGKSKITNKINYVLNGNTIYLKAGKYRDMSTNDVNVTFTLNSNYYPIVYTLTKNDKEIAKGNIEEIKRVFNNSEIINKDDIKDDNYKLSWKWVSTNKKADIYLDKVISGSLIETSENYNINESIELNIEITE